MEMFQKSERKKIRIRKRKKMVSILFFPLLLVQKEFEEVISIQGFFVALFFLFLLFESSAPHPTRILTIFTMSNRYGSSTNVRASSRIFLFTKHLTVLVVVVVAKQESYQVSKKIV